jgi:hypothetical protein
MSNTCLQRKFALCKHVDKKIGLAYRLNMTPPRNTRLIETSNLNCTIACHLPSQHSRFITQFIQKQNYSVILPLTVNTPGRKTNFHTHTQINFQILLHIFTWIPCCNLPPHQPPLHAIYVKQSTSDWWTEILNILFFSSWNDMYVSINHLQIRFRFN